MAVPPVDSVSDTTTRVVEKVRNLTREISRLTSERDRLSAQLRDSRTLEEELREEKERLQVKLRDHQFRAEELSRKEESLERQLAMFKQRVVALSQEKESLENKLNTSRGTADNLHAGRESLAAKLEHVEAELSSLRLEQESTRRKLTDSESELGALRGENAALNHRFSEVEAARLKLSGDKGGLESAFRETHEKLNAATAEKETLSKELEETRGVKEQLQDELDRLVFRSRREYFRFGLVALSVVAVACFIFWASMVLFNKGLRQDLDDAEKLNATLQSDLRSYLSKLDEKNKAMIDLEKQLADMKIKMKELGDELRMGEESHGALMENKDSIITDLRARIKFGEDQKTKELAKQKAELESIIQVLRAEVAHKQGEVDELTRIKDAAIEPLIEALSHPDVNVRVMISGTLTRLTGKMFGPDQRKWRDWWMRRRYEAELER